MRVSKEQTLASKNMLKSDKFINQTYQFDLEKSVVNDDNVMLAGTPYPVHIATISDNYVKNGDFNLPVENVMYGDLYVYSYEIRNGSNFGLKSNVKNVEVDGVKTVQLEVEGIIGDRIIGQIYIALNETLKPELWDKGTVKLTCKISADRKTGVYNPTLSENTGGSYMKKTFRSLGDDAGIKEFKTLSAYFNKPSGDCNTLVMYYTAEGSKKLTINLADVSLVSQTYSKRAIDEHDAIGLTFEDVDFKEGNGVGSLMIKGSVSDEALPNHVPDETKAELKNINFL